MGRIRVRVATDIRCLEPLNPLILQGPLSRFPFLWEKGVMTARAAWAPVFAVTVPAVMWGLFWIPLREMEARGLSGDWSSIALYGAGAVVMLPLVLLTRDRKRGTKRAALAVGILFGAVLALWSHAILIGEVVRVTLLFYMSPVWATVFGMVFLGDRPSMVRAATIVCGLCGAAVVLGLRDGGLPIPHSTADWMSIAAGVLFAAAATVGRKAGGRGISEQTFATFFFCAVFAWLLVVVMPGGEPPPPALASPALWGMVVAAAALWLVPASWFLLWGAGRLDPGRTAILLILEVGAAALSSGLLTDEPLGLAELFGSILILGAAAIETVGSGREGR